MFQMRPEEEKTQQEVDREIREMSYAIREMSRGKIPADVMGSYTGTPADEDGPTQDADDL